MDAAQFRADFPEFASQTVYPDSAVTFWITVAGKLLRACAWADLIDVGTELFVAHNLSLEKLAAANGGMNSGVITGKTVDKLSVTYDASVGIVPDAGHWNLTTYGTRFLWLLNMAGMGPTQLGAGAVVYGLSQPGFVVGGLLGYGWPHG